MKLLLLGGTVFLGRHIVEAALARGHEVTLFTRGRHNPELFPQCEHLRGDRDSGLDPLRGRTWDAVIDTSGYIPRVVRASAELLASAAPHYTFISSISAYADLVRPGMDERAPLATMPDATVEEVTGETYGPLKVLCEQAAEETMPGRVLIIRPGLIGGPHDPTDRFTYWPARAARGGEILAPGRPARQVQIIDARDLAEWNVRMVEDQRTGVFNATGPGNRLTMGQLLDTCIAVAGGQARVTWADESFLVEAGVSPWMDLPLWIPETEGAPAGMLSVSVAGAVAAGLTFRPLATIVADTLAWDRSRDPTQPRAAGLTPEREREVLARWHART